MEDFPPKALCETCPQPATTPPRPSMGNGKVRRPIPWRGGRRKKRTLSSSPSEEEAPHTPTSPQSVPPSPSGGRTLSEWTAETDLRHGRPIWFQSREQVPGSWKALGGGRPRPHCAPQQRPPGVRPLSCWSPSPPDRPHTQPPEASARRRNLPLPTQQSNRRRLSIVRRPDRRGDEGN